MTETCNLVSAKITVHTCTHEDATRETNTASPNLRNVNNTHGYNFSKMVFFSTFS